MNGLSDAGRIVVREASVPGTYRFWRGLIRAWMKVSNRPVRVLGEVPRPCRPRPMLMVAGHPPSLAACLILAAACDPPIRCFLPEEEVRGFWRRLLAKRLGVISDLGDKASLEAACFAAGRDELLVAFADPELSLNNDHGADGGRTGQLAMELERRASERERLAPESQALDLVPIHVFLPQPPLNSSHVLIHFDPPLGSEAEGGEVEGVAAAGAKDLLRALEPAFRRNVFRLRPADLRDFLSDIEDAVRQDLDSKPVTPPERKPKLDGFVLSEFLEEWAEYENRMNPGGLVSLRGELDAWREGHRVVALAEIEAATCGPWMGSAPRRAAAWAETFAGFPVAVFGVINSLAALAILKAAGIAHIEKRRENPRRWLTRAGIALVVFALQTAICYWWWGRSAAGAYAVAAPVSALYLWRYAWLVRHRSRLVFRKLLNSRAHARLDDLRRRFLVNLNRSRDAYAERRGVAH